MTYKWISNFSIFCKDRWPRKSLRSEVVSFLTGERDCLFVASSSDSKVANGSTDELDIRVAKARPVIK